MGTKRPPDRPPDDSSKHPRTEQGVTDFPMNWYKHGGSHDSEAYVPLTNKSIEGDTLPEVGIRRPGYGRWGEKIKAYLPHHVLMRH